MQDAHQTMDNLGLNEAVPPGATREKRRLQLVLDNIRNTSEERIAQVLEGVENEEQKVLLKIAQAFLKNRYPLSASGEKLREQIQKLLENNDLEALQSIKNTLPTVEQPHPELFADLDLPPEEIHKIMGPGLANIQITKGCSHKCDFCAANAEGKVSFMPYAAILKIAAEKKKAEHELDQKIVDYCRKKGTEPDQGIQIKISEYKSLFGVDDLAVEMELKQGYKDYYSYAVWLANGLDTKEEEVWKGLGVRENFRKLQEIFKAHDNSVTKALHIFINHKTEIIAHLKAIAANIQQGIKDEVEQGPGYKPCKRFRSTMEEESISTYKLYGRTGIMVEGLLRVIDEIPETFEDIEVPISNDDLFGNFKDKIICNYYDSDPFDYRDSSFLHKDGSPADFGDVVNILGSKDRKIHITTAGWSVKDKAAQRAAEKIAKSNYISLIRISVNPSEIDAKKDFVKYVAKMKQVIETLRNTFYPPEQGTWEHGQEQTQILLFNDTQNLEYQTRVVQEIKKFCQEMNVHFFIQEPVISRFSGPTETAVGRDTDHDVMSCMPGHHIWPDGTIADQNLGIGYLTRGHSDWEYHDSGTPKGSRPTPTGKKLFHITQ